MLVDGNDADLLGVGKPVYVAAKLFPKADILVEYFFQSAFELFACRLFCPHMKHDIGVFIIVALQVW